MKSLLLLTVLVLGYVLVAVAPASAISLTTASLDPVLDIAVVRGTDNGVYWNSYNLCTFCLPEEGWGSWQSLSGSTLSAPGICEAAGASMVYVVVRGMDNGIYVKAWSGGTWSSWVSPPGGGATIDQPACALLGSVLYVVVRGVTNELYWDSLTCTPTCFWSGWKDLHGASASAPVLVSTPYFGRLDLFVQGTSNGIYHKAYTGGAWASSWDSPGGATTSKPAAALYTEVYACTPGPCIESDTIVVVVRGTDNNVYHNYYEISPTPGWGTWYSLSGQTLSAPTLAYDANGCTPGTQSNCYATDALAVRGTNNAVYHITLALNIFSAWDSPGGVIQNSPALAYCSGSGSSTQFLLLVEGYPSIYSNTVTGATWGTYSSVGGATPSDPALVAIV